MAETSELTNVPAQSPSQCETLRVAMYASPLRSIRTPTGVGQHIAQMAGQLATHPSVSLTLVAPRTDHDQAREEFSKPLSRVPVHYLPGSERLLRAAMISTRLFPIEKWTGDVDWVYSPKEQPVATRRARLAVTVHDVLPFEKSIAGVSRSCSPSTALRWKLLMRRINERADLIATVSAFTRRRLIELLKIRDEDRIVVIGNGVGSEYFEPRRPDDAELLQRHRLETGQYLMSVGSLTFRKGGDLLLRLARKFHERKEPWRVVVTGRRHDAELLAKYNAIRAEIPQFPMDLTGYISDADQATLLRNASVLIFPSRYEGFGIPVLEAMGAGTPVICMRTSALPEVAGDAALFIDGDDVDEWHAQIERLAAGDADRAALVAAGRSRAAAFTWNRCAARLVAAMTERS